MQLGTRWAFGGRPPAAVPASMHAAIAAHEASAEGTWTLTFLEGRAIATGDDGFVVDERGGSAPADAAGADDDW